jgi:Ca2+-binding RTX toxin-like protein
MRTLENTLSWLRSFRQNKRRLPALRRATTEALEARTLLTEFLVGSAGDDRFTVDYSQMSDFVFVSYQTVVDGATRTFDLGSFPMSEDLLLDGSTGVTNVEILGGPYGDTFNLTTPGRIVTNGSNLIPVSPVAHLNLIGGNGDDIYRLDGDTIQSAITIEERSASSDIDTIDLAATSASVRLDLNKMSLQQVTSGLMLSMSERAVENVVGGSGNDIIDGNHLHNRIQGMSGNDRISGRGGNDVLEGGQGWDRFIFGTPTFTENDSVIENAGQGADTLDFATLSSSVNINLGLTSRQVVHANRTLQLSNAIENVTGGTGSDRLIGNSFRNAIRGNGGNDILLGVNGDDVLHGGDGRDLLIGGMGADVLNGGNDDDMVFTGHSIYDNNFSALNAIRNQWSSDASYSSRVSSLRSGVGNPQVSLKPAETVLNDGDSQIDDAQASAGIDWFFLRFYWEGQENAGSGQVDWL